MSKIELTSNLRNFIEYVRPLGIVNSLKHILENSKITLAEITLLIPQSKRETEDFINSREIYKNLINNGYKTTETKTVERIIINKFNTIEKLIEALESCIDIDNIRVLGWNIIDIEKEIGAMLGRDCSDLKESEIIERLLKS